MASLSRSGGVGVRVVFLVFLLLLTPVLAQDHMRDVYTRENERLDLLVKWSPGQVQPSLPPVLPFDPGKVAPAKEAPAIDTESPEEDPPDWNFTSWIIDYNKGISLAEADLISRTIVALLPSTRRRSQAGRGVGGRGVGLSPGRSFSGGRAGTGAVDAGNRRHAGSDRPLGSVAELERHGALSLSSTEALGSGRVAGPGFL